MSKPLEANLLRERLPFRPLGGARRVTSLELATEIGFADLRKIDRWFLQHRAELSTLLAQPIPVDVFVPIGHGRVRKTRVHWLEGGHVIAFIFKCRTDRTERALLELIEEACQMEDELGLDPFASFWER
jgi:hypothetical protein